MPKHDNAQPQAPQPQETSEVAKAKEVLSAPSASTPAQPTVTMNIGDLQTLITNLMESANQRTERALETLAQAIQDSRKPYKSEAELANDAALREQDRKTRERIMKEMKRAQDACPHMQGSSPLSDFSGQLTSIIQHVRDVGDVIGICTNCNRIFRPEDPDYRQWMMKKSGNKPSQSGRRFFSDPLAAQQAANN